jgi:chromosome segregation ATPase
MPPSSTSALEARIDRLEERMVAGFTDIQDMLRSYDERTRAIERLEAGCQPIVYARLDAIQQDLLDHNTRLAMKSQQIININTQMSDLMHMYRLFVWVGTAMGGSIISLIVALITGHAQVVFK